VKASSCAPILAQSLCFTLDKMNREAQIRAYYSALAAVWGPQHWWPAQSRFEVIVGAYLTQNTAWTNVERAFANLRRARVLSLNGIRDIPIAELETLIRSAGYFRQKAQRLKTFIAYLDASYRGSLDRMFAQPTEKLREELLALNGVGPETADSILLYAGNHPVFVVDAYTRRILDRHAILTHACPYEDFRNLFERALAEVHERSGAAPFAVRGGCVQTAPEPYASGAPKDGEVVRGAAHRPSRMSLTSRSPLVQTFNEMHALIVGVGKNHCFNRNPDCERCPLRPFLPSVG
jgi:endonuclease III related protein